MPRLYVNCKYYWRKNVRAKIHPMFYVLAVYLSDTFVVFLFFVYCSVRHSYRKQHLNPYIYQLPIDFKIINIRESGFWFVQPQISQNKDIYTMRVMKHGTWKGGKRRASKIFGHQLESKIENWFRKSKETAKK